MTTTETTTPQDTTTQRPPLPLDSTEAMDLFDSLCRAIGNRESNGEEDNTALYDEVAHTAAALTRIARGLHTYETQQFHRIAYRSCEGTLHTETTTCDVFDDQTPVVVALRLSDVVDPDTALTGDQLYDIASQLHEQVGGMTMPDIDDTMSDETISAWLSLRNSAHTLSLVAGKMAGYIRRRQEDVERVKRPARR